MNNDFFVKREPLGNGYDFFMCPKCRHKNPLVFSDTMQALADMTDKFNCEECGQTVVLV